MSDSQRLFDDAKKFSAQFAGFLKASELFGTVASIDQATAEAKTRLITAQSEEKAFEKTRADRKKQFEQEVAANQKQAAGIIEQKSREGASIVADARKTAEAIAIEAMVKAQVDAEQAILKAKADALQYATAAKNAKLELDRLTPLVAEHQHKLDDLTKAHAVMTKRHETVKAALAELRAKL